MFHLMHGTDDFSARQDLRKLLDDARFAGNIERFDGANADIQAVRLACETFPFLADGRLVVVDGLPKPKRGSKESAPEEGEKPAKGKKGAKKPSATALAKEFVATLAEVASDLPATTTLAVLVDEELPKTHPLIAAATAHGRVHLYTALQGPALEKWIAQRATSEGGKLTPEAARLLAAMAVGDPRRLAQEVAKLVTYVGPGNVVDVDVVQRLVSDSRETRVFDLTDALARGDRPRALSVLHELLNDGEAPLGMVAMIARQVRQLVQVKDLAARGVRGAELASAAGVPPFLVEKTVAQARQFSLAQLERAQRACLEVDTALKRSRMTPDLALDLLIAEFGRPG